MIHSHVSLGIMKLWRWRRALWLAGMMDRVKEETCWAEGVAPGRSFWCWNHSVLIGVVVPWHCIGFHIYTGDCMQNGWHLEYKFGLVLRTPVSHKGAPRLNPWVLLLMLAFCHTDLERWQWWLKEDWISGWKLPAQSMLWRPSREWTTGFKFSVCLFTCQIN